MKPVDRLTFSREVARASVERDKCIRLLNLDKKKADDWNTILIPEPTDE